MKLILHYSGLHRWICLILFLFNTVDLHAQMQAQAGYASNGEVKIHYKVYGNGRPVLVINGGPGFSSRHMEGFAQELAAKKFQVILFDQRGTGHSTLPRIDSTTLSVGLIVEDIKVVIKATGNKSVSILGHSFGGILAMQFACRHPEFIDQMVPCSSAGIDLSFLDYFADNIAQRLSPQPADTLPAPTTEQERETFFYRMLANNAPAYLFDKSKTKAFVDMLTVPGSYRPEFNRVIWADLFAQKYDLSKKIGKFKKPVLVVQGRQDIVGDETAMRIHQAIPSSKLVFIHQCGHVPWLDQPEQFYRALSGFLNGK